MPGLAFLDLDYCAGLRKVTGKGQSSGNHVCSASLSPCKSEAISTNPISAPFEPYISPLLSSTVSSLDFAIFR